MSEKPKRPGVVLAAAILLFVFGGFSILGVCGAIVPYVTPAAAPQQKGGNPPIVFVDPTPKLIAEEPEIMGVMTAFTVFGAILGIVKIWAGIGILQLRPSARVTGILVALATIVLSIAQSVHSALYFVPAYLRIFARDNAPELANIKGIIEIVLWVLTGVSIAGSIALWLIVILLLNSKRARNSFAGISDTPMNEPEPEPRSRYAGYDDDDDAYPRSSPHSPDETGITNRPN